MATATHPWDIVDSLDTEERIAAYLEAALDQGDSVLVAAALDDITRAKRMNEDARQGKKSL